MRILGINAVFHDPAAALVVDGTIVAAAEEERFSRRKHGKANVAFSVWEMPERSARWCVERANLAPDDLDAVAYSDDPSLSARPGPDLTADGWEGLRTLYAQRAGRFLAGGWHTWRRLSLTTAPQEKSERGGAATSSETICWISRDVLARDPLNPRSERRGVDRTQR